MKVLIFIEHDVVVRHFLHSAAFADLIARHDVKFVFPEPGFKRVKSDISRLKLAAPFRHLTVHQERLVIWKRLFQVNLLRWRPGASAAGLRRLNRKMIGPKAAAYYTFLALPGIFGLFRRRSFAYASKIPNTALDDLISEEKPDLILHPSVLEGAYINDLVASSKTTGIPLAVIMNSWDNPSTKQAMVGQPEWLLVWGPQTRQHAIDFVKMSPKQVVNFGAAQFDVYRHPPRIDRETFCARHGIDPAKKVLLYAGSSKETDEYSHLEALENAIEDARLKDLAVVYRPHPWGNGGKDGGRIIEREWRHIRIEETMRTYLEGVRDGNTAMSLPDYRDTHDVLSSIDALVSPLSTIILEGALHGKPTLCFLPVEEEDAHHLQLVLPLKHFEDMFNSPEFPTARGLPELVPGIAALLDRIDDDAHCARLAEACAHFVTPFDRPYGERLTEFCEAVARKTPKDTATINA
ncbi:MAG: hypothetical protein NXI27_15530 [Alphaproteobacteria bacterium]|nr:hypothetical protein [Alphaproteobacteria bacterium]